MAIYLKLMLKNINEKKARTALIIFSITMAAALFFASITISDTMIKIFTDKVKKSFGESEIVIAANDESPTKYFNNNIADALSDEFEYTVGIVESSALYKPTKEESVVFKLNGMDWEDIQILSPVKLDQEQDLKPFDSRKIIIQKTKAEKYGLKTGDILELQIEGNLFKFKIAGIASSSGFFTGETDMAVVPKDLLSSIVSQKGSVSTLYIKLKEPIKKEQIIKKLSGFIKRYDVKETISKQELKERTQTFTSILSLMLMIIVFLSIFIIYVSFKVITAERLPFLGTLRSVGASKKASNLILIGESIFYGIIGGAFACALGIGILYLMVMSNAEGGRVSLTLNIMQFLLTFAMAIVLSLASASIPILSVSRIPIKDIVLNKVELKESKRKTWKLILGIILLSAPIVIPPYASSSGDIALLVDTACIVLVVAAIVQVVPHFTTGFIFFFEKIYILIFGNIGVLAAKNLRDNKNILNNISLLAIGIATVLMVNTAGKSIFAGISNFAQSVIKYDLTFSVDEMDRSTEARIKSVEGIADVYGFYAIKQIEVVGFKEKIRELEGISKDKFPEFKNFNMSYGETMKSFEELDSGRNIILTELLRSRYKAKVGDTITLVLNKRNREYKVIDLVDTMNQDGSYAMISDRYFKMDTGQAYYESIGIKTNSDPAAVFGILKSKFSRSAPSGMTTQEHVQNILKEGSDITAMMDGISILTMVIGIFGVLNNLTISFIQRKRSLAVLRSVGLSKSQSLQMIFIEALSSGLIGGTMGALSGWVMLSVMPHLTKALIATIPMQYTISSFVLAAASGVMITLVASISTAMKSSKLSIVQSIKYE